VIHIPEINNIKFLTSKKLNIKKIVMEKPLTPFSNIIIEFLDELSKEIIKSADARKFSDVIAFAMWSRQSNLNSIKRQYEKRGEIRLGKGIVFHVAPRNVPINFAFSLAAGLLSGNINIVRVSTMDFLQVVIIVDLIKKILVLEKFSMISEFIHIVQYEHSKEINDIFSQVCDVRIIWGGDETIRRIRESPIPVKSYDVNMNDRYSFVVLNSKEVIKCKNLDVLCRNFYNDTYYSDQNACTSPHLIVWVGDNEENKRASDIFWRKLYQLVEKKYTIQPTDIIEKINRSYEFVATHPNEKIESTVDMKILKIKISKIYSDLGNFKFRNGMFLEHECENLQEIQPMITSKYQTLSYFGFSSSELIDFISTNRLKGVDRVVEIGKTMDFSLTWDGYDLISSLSRKLGYNTFER
jgi:hypothetical protein